MKYQLQYLIIIFISFGISDASIAQIDENNSKPRNPNQMQLPSGDGTLDKQKSHLVTTRSTTINAKTSLTLNFPDDFRSIDGSNNNLVNTDWGQAEISFIRLANVNYLDGAYVMDNTLPSPRLISNICHSMPINTQIDTPNVSDMLWQWGQFLDHDITLSPEVTPAEDAEIHVPLGDAWFDPNSEGNKIISFGRSSYTTDSQSIRQQTNAITAYIDASNVYGSDTIRASALRTNDNSGKLKTSAGNLLPFNTDGIPNAPSADASFFLGGDFRANEQIGLTSMHIVFVREHNRLAEKISIEQPELSGEEIYQHARALVAAQMQVITYNEFLPLLLGNKIPDYSGYKPNINASISNEFATAAYRFGHTMLSPQILRLDENGNEAQHGHVALRDAFFKPSEISEYGIESLLRGLSQQRAQKIDLKIVDDVRNMLFGPPGSGGLDLASLNIQRGRDHGLASYTQTRQALGLSSVTTFADITSDLTIQEALKQTYSDVGDIDLWTGGLAEPVISGALVGETISAILIDQFIRLRDGDRFWYQRYLPNELIEWVEEQTLAKIIKRNTDIDNELTNNVFIIQDNIQTSNEMCTIIKPKNGKISLVCL